MLIAQSNYSRDLAIKIKFVNFVNKYPTKKCIKSASNWALQWCLFYDLVLMLLTKFISNSTFLKSSYGITLLIIM